MTVKTITKAQYQQLLGLKLIADKHNEAMNDLEAAAMEIVQETERDGSPVDFGGHVSDTLYGSHSIDEMLKILKIKVK